MKKIKRLIRAILNPGMVSIYPNYEPYLRMSDGKFYQIEQEVNGELLVRTVLKRGVELRTIVPLNDLVAPDEYVHNRPLIPKGATTSCGEVVDVCISEDGIDFMYKLEGNPLWKKDFEIL